MHWLVVAMIVLFLDGAASAAPSMPGRLEFEVLRNGQMFGRHIVSVSENGASLRVRTAVDLRAGLGPLTLYRYTQDCTETWSDGVLSAFQCATMKDGRRLHARGHASGGQIHVTGPEGALAFTLGALPTSWWTQPPARATTLIDTQTGAAMRVRVSDLGAEAIDVGGRRVQARHVRVTGSIPVDLWYDGQGRWIGCAFTVQGQNITYELVSPLDAGPA